jgi:hypothetical protein
MPVWYSNSRAPVASSTATAAAAISVRVAPTLADLAAAFGADRPAALCRELTNSPPPADRPYFKPRRQLRLAPPPRTHAQGIRTAKPR